MKRSNNNTTIKNNNSYTFRLTAPIASIITFFKFKPVTEKELAETLDSSSRENAIAKKNIEESNELLKTSKDQIKISDGFIKK